MVKKIVIGILIFLIGVAIAGFFLPTEIDIERSVTINAPIGYVFDEINDLRRWKDWSYQQSTDPSMEISYTSRYGKFAGLSWESSRDSGSLKFVEYHPDSLIRTENITGKDTAWEIYKMNTVDKHTVLAIRFIQKNFKTPFNTWMAFLFTRMEINKRLTYQLEKLKYAAENRPVFDIEITEESLAPTYYISRHHKMSSKKRKDILLQQDKMFAELSAIRSTVQPSFNGHAFCLLLVYDFQYIEMICALPIEPADTKFPAEYPPSQHYSGTVIKGIHIGNHDSLKESHTQVKQYVDYKKFEMNGDPWEIYIHKGVDTSKWVTEVYYPVK